MLGDVQRSIGRLDCFLILAGSHVSARQVGKNLCGRVLIRVANSRQPRLHFLDRTAEIARVNEDSTEQSDGVCQRARVVRGAVDTRAPPAQASRPAPDGC